MEASPVRIIQYFDGSKQGIIPLFQRPYSWEIKDWNILWDDVTAQYEATERASHFMGAVVTVPVKSVPVGVAKHLVIDGQQRLTTISLLLAAIRDRAASLDDNVTAGIVGDLLLNRHYQAPDDLKIVPTQTDRAAFNALVHERDVEQFAQTTIIQAYEHFLRKLEGKDSEGEPYLAAQILQTIQQSLQVVMINLGESDDPYLIFESLNHKGKPLNQADLVRNYVLMRFQHSTTAGGEQERIYDELWRPMELALEGQMTEFLRHYGMRFGRNVRKGDIYSASKIEFEKLEDAGQVSSTLKEMKLAALGYQKFLRPDEEGNARISRALRSMQDLDSTVFNPLLIRLYRGWEKEVISTDVLARCLETLESFHVRRLVCRVPTNALNKITLELCLHLPDTELDVWLEDKLSTGSGSRSFPSDVEFMQALLSQHLYPRKRIARYVLLAFESAFGHKEPADISTATIEHVMPQTLSEDWKTSLGPEHEAVHEKWLDTLGNLTLTGYNAELGNDGFTKKKELLANSHFELTKEVLACHQWGPAEIESRAQKLAEMALTIWPKA